MNKISRYEELTGSAVVTKFRSSHEKALYEYFNTNGACAMHNAARDTLFQYVKTGLINSGWLLSRSAEYHVTGLLKEVKKTRSNRFNIWYHAAQIRENAEKTYNDLARFALGEIGRNGQPL